MCYIVFITNSLHWRYIKTALQEYVIIYFKIHGKRLARPIRGEAVIVLIIIVISTPYVLLQDEVIEIPTEIDELVDKEIVDILPYMGFDDEEKGVEIVRIHHTLLCFISFLLPVVTFRFMTLIYGSIGTTTPISH